MIWPYTYTLNHEKSVLGGSRYLTANPVITNHVQISSKEMAVNISIKMNMIC